MLTPARLSLSSFALLSTSPCSSAIINHAATRSFFLSSSIPSSTVKQQQQHIAAAASRAGCLCCPPTTKSSKTTPPHIYQQTRSFDRPRYFAEKRRLKALNDKENVTMEEALQVFRIYCLGESRAVQAHIQLEKGESGSKPVRGEVTLPKQISSSEAAADGSSSSGSADKSIILVFAKAGPHATLAKQLGAHIVGAEDLIADVLSGNVVKFDKVLSTKEMFPHVIKIAKLLGPKGLMPSPARGTVSDDIETMMASLKASTKYEMDEDGFIHLDIARSNWVDADIQANLSSLLKSLVENRPAKSVIQKYIKEVSISGGGGGVSAGSTPAVILPRKHLIPDLAKKD